MCSIEVTQGGFSRFRSRSKLFCRCGYVRNHRRRLQNLSLLWTCQRKRGIFCQPSVRTRKMVLIRKESPRLVAEGGACLSRIFDDLMRLLLLCLCNSARDGSQNSRWLLCTVLKMSQILTKKIKSRIYESEKSKMKTAKDAKTYSTRVLPECWGGIDTNLKSFQLKISDVLKIWRAYFFSFVIFWLFVKWNNRNCQPPVNFGSR